MVITWEVLPHNDGISPVVDRDLRLRILCCVELPRGWPPPRTGRPIGGDQVGVAPAGRSGPDGNCATPRAQRNVSTDGSYSDLGRGLPTARRTCGEGRETSCRKTRSNNTH
jgi:hypothetical protein